MLQPAACCAGASHAVTTAGIAVGSVAGGIVGIAVFVALIMLGARVAFVRRRLRAMRVRPALLVLCWQAPQDPDGTVASPLHTAHLS